METRRKIKLGNKPTAIGREKAEGGGGGGRGGGGGVAPEGEVGWGGGVGGEEMGGEGGCATTPPHPRPNSPLSELVTPHPHPPAP